MLPIGHGEEEMDVSGSSETAETNINRSESICLSAGGVYGAVENVTEEMELGEEVNVEGDGLGVEDGQLPDVVSELGTVTVHEVTGGEGGPLTDSMPGLTRPEVISVLRTIAEADPEEAREIFAAAGLSLTFCPGEPC